MPLPLALIGLGVAAVVGIGAKVVEDKVESAQQERIKTGKANVLECMKKKIDSMLQKLEQYEHKIKYQFCISVVCAAVICFFVFLVDFDPAGVLMVIVLQFTSMYLFADTVVLLLYKEDVRDFLKAYRRNMKQHRIRKDAVREAVRQLIGERLTTSTVENMIKEEVDKKIRKLDFPDKMAWTIFGKSRETITKEIYETASEEIDEHYYDEIGKRIRRIFGRIIRVALTFGIAVMLLRLGAPEVAGLGWWSWITLPIAFSAFFWWHRQKLKS